MRTNNTEHDRARRALITNIFLTYKRMSNYMIDACMFIEHAVFQGPYGLMLTEVDLNLTTRARIPSFVISLVYIVP